VSNYFKKAIDIIDPGWEVKTTTQCIPISAGTMKQNQIAFFISRVYAAMTLCNYKTFDQINGGGKILRQKCLHYLKELDNDMRKYHEETRTNTRAPLASWAKEELPYASVTTSGLKQMSHSDEADEPLFREVNKVLDDLKDCDKHDSSKRKELDDAFFRVRIACDPIVNRKKRTTLTCPELYKLCRK